MGVTRLAELTGLDRSRLPVFAAIRPNARSIVGAQGKGLKPDLAKVSAIAEAIESHAAEQPVHGCLNLSLAAATPAEQAFVRRALRDAAPSADHGLSWVEARLLGHARTMRVPLDMVDLDFTRPAELAGWTRQTSGLGAGSHPLEALVHALLELIERDAYARFVQLPPHRLVRLDIAGQGDPELDHLLTLLDQARLDLAVYDATTDLDVPVVIARLMPRDPEDGTTFGPTFGAGCHLSPAIAAMRAVTEACQGRLGHIAGSRDDIEDEEYQAGARARLLALMQDTAIAGRPARRLAELADRAQATLAGDLDLLRERLARVGITEVAVVELPCIVPMFFVVRAIVAELGRQAGRARWLPRLERRVAA